MQIFGTVLHEVFRENERLIVRDSLEELCSPLDSYGWASVGIYAFFDPLEPDYDSPGKKLLYIGLAKDLPERFSQHMGLISFSQNGCKRLNVDEWFGRKNALGFACFVQSPLAQVDTHRERDRHRREAHDEELADGLISNPPHGLESAVLIEGQSIETFRLIHGVRPLWNRMGGSREGAARALSGSAAGLLGLLDGSQSSLFRARRTIRELAIDPRATLLESGPLHTARSLTLLAAVERAASDRDILDTLHRLASHSLYQQTDLPEQVSQLFSSGYLE